MNDMAQHVVKKYPKKMKNSLSDPGGEEAADASGHFGPSHAEAAEFQQALL
jgi:hypothetical protein